MKELQKYYQQFIQFLEKIFYSDTAKKLRYRLDNILESSNERLDTLLENQNPKKHRLQGQLLASKSILSKEHDGYNLCGLGIDPVLSRQGVLINGNAGSFKTSGAIVKSILSVYGSQIIHDPSGELYFLTSAALSKFGFKILRLDFSNPNNSISFNPLSRLNTLSDISNFASELINSEKGSFWDTKSTELIIVVMSTIKNMPKKYHSMSNVCMILDYLQTNQNREQIDKLFEEYASAKMILKYASVMSNSPATLSSIISTGQTAVQLFDLDTNIIQICSNDTIGDFNNLRTQPTVLFIHTSTAKMQYYSKITSVFFNQYFGSFFERLPTEQELDVYFHIDEAPVLQINNLDLICSNIRKYRGNIMLVTQNANSQLDSVYGKRSESILANLRTKVYYSADLKTATDLEKIAGKYEYVDTQDGDKMKSRSVLTTDEIIALPTDKCLIHISGMRIILANVTPYFLFRELQELTSLPPYEFTKNAQLSNPVLINLNALFPKTETP